MAIDVDAVHAELVADDVLPDGDLLIVEIGQVSVVRTTASGCGLAFNTGGQLCIELSQLVFRLRNLIDDAWFLGRRCLLQFGLQ